MYSSELLDHFEHPRNAGEVADADLACERTNPVCGDVLHLSVRLAEGKIAEIGFLARGCVPAMACGSLITELAMGRRLEDLAAVTPEEVAQRIGGLPTGSDHAAELACEVLHGLARARGDHDAPAGG